MNDSIDYVTAIARSGLTIYSSIEVGDPNLWIPSLELETLLHNGLQGLSLSGLPLRTRSKRVKESICQILGYPVPKSFQKTQPRFSGQCFDTYIQKSNNLQIWNEELSPTRRYVLIRLSETDVVQRVKVITGDDLAILDTTGTLTKKFQARLSLRSEATELVAPEDTDRVRPLVSHDVTSTLSGVSPVEYPSAGAVIPISKLFNRLTTLVGKTFSAVGHDQERNRGSELHKLVCDALGYSFYADDGRFPDIRHQLLEIKLQTSLTIDLGLVRPNSTEPLDMSKTYNVQIRHCDVRYAIFYAVNVNGIIELTHLFMTTGESLFGRFPQFQGKVLNSKLQIPLPATFFD